MARLICIDKLRRNIKRVTRQHFLLLPLKRSKVGQPELIREFTTLFFLVDVYHGNWFTPLF